MKDTSSKLIVLSAVAAIIALAVVFWHEHRQLGLRTGSGVEQTSREDKQAVRDARPSQEEKPDEDELLQAKPGLPGPNPGGLLANVDGEFAESCRKSAYVQSGQANNNLFYVLDGKERAVRTLPAETKQGITAALTFSKLRFSSQGAYLLYNINGWEGYWGEVYDTENSQVLDIKLPSADLWGVSLNEKYLYACAGSAFSGDFYARVYGLPGLETVYEFDNFHDDALYTMSCLYEPAGEKLTISYYCSPDHDPGCDPAKRSHIEIDLKQGQVIREEHNTGSAEENSE